MKMRTESNELRIYRSLSVRMDLTAKEKRRCFSLEKGYQGELLFDEWLEPLSQGRILLPDLNLQYNNNFFQTDSVMMTSHTNYLFEVKNFEGDYTIKGENWYSPSGEPVQNPVLQLKRSEPLFRSLLREYGSNLPLESYVIFVNPQFHLYTALSDLPVIYPTQLERFIESLKQRPSFLKNPHRHTAEQLLARELPGNPHARLPVYDYAGLKKGIVCAGCGGFYTKFQRGSLICNYCGFKEISHYAVLKTISEFMLLFPDIKITTSQALDWCGIIKSPVTMQKILTENFELIKNGRGSYYQRNNKGDL